MTNTPSNALLPTGVPCAPAQSNLLRTGSTSTNSTTHSYQPDHELSFRSPEHEGVFLILFAAQQQLRKWGKLPHTCPRLIVGESTPRASLSLTGQPLIITGAQHRILHAAGRAKHPARFSNFYFFLRFLLSDILDASNGLCLSWGVNKQAICISDTRLTCVSVRVLNSLSIVSATQPWNRCLKSGEERRDRVLVAAKPSPRTICASHQ